MLSREADYLMVASQQSMQGGTLGMKTSQQIIGLPVVSISDGNEIGKVKNIMINAVKGTVDFFVIDSAMRSLAGGVVPVGKVLGIGADALTILEADDVSDIVKIPSAIDLLQKNITVRGTRVLTRKGSLLGEAGDIFINEDDACGIVGVEFVPGSNKVQPGIIPRDSIITFGKNLLVVEEGFVDCLHPMPAPDTVIDVPSAPVTSVGLDNMLNTDASMANGTFQKVEEDDSEAENISEPEISLDGLFSEDSSISEAGTMLEDRRIAYLRGRRITETIIDTDGGVIASAGDIIDDDMMEKARQAGRLVELVMNNEA